MATLGLGVGADGQIIDTEIYFAIDAVHLISSAGFDLRRGSVVATKKLERGDLDTPINANDLTISLLRNFPFYCEGVAQIAAEG